MSYQERKALVSIITTLGVTTLYIAYMAPQYPQADAYSQEVFRFWGHFFLILVPVSIVARIIVEIVFVILNTIFTRDEVTDRSDERTRLIELKSTRNAMWTFAFGFFVAMGSLAAEMQPAFMFAVLIGSGLLSSLVSDISDFYFYRRGY